MPRTISATSEARYFQVIGIVYAGKCCRHARSSGMMADGDSLFESGLAVEDSNDRYSSSMW